MTIATRVSSRSARFWRGRLKTSGRAVKVWRSAAQRSTSNASLRPRPYRKTEKSLSNEITREMPSRSMSAKEVRSTREKSWSGKRSWCIGTATLPGANRLSDHARFLRCDISPFRAAEVEDDGPVNASWGFGQVLIHESAYVLGKRNVQSGCTRANSCMQLRTERNLGANHHCGATIQAAE